MSKICSFCDSKQENVEILVQSPKIRHKTSWICNRCVETCNQIIALSRHGMTCPSCQMSIHEIESARGRRA